MHRAGLFSICSTTLSDLNLLDGLQVNRINGRQTFEYYKPFQSLDLWPILFRSPDQAVGIGEKIPGEIWNSHLEVYSQLDISQFESRVRKYFSPSVFVRNQLRHLVRRYGPKKPGEISIGLHIRGTDKSIEIPATPTENYLSVAEEILSRHQKVSFVAMSDSSAISQEIKRAFGTRVKIISNLRMSETSRGVHKSLPRISRVSEAANFLAAILFMASREYVITHTGNGAFWTVLFRGNTNGVTQFRAGDRF